MSQPPAFSTECALPTTAPRRLRLPVIRAGAGDHAGILCFLQSVFQGPSRAEFEASLADPFYEPRDRLLLRRQRRVVAHAHITHRTMRLGSLAFPAAGLNWFGVAPEHRGQGLGGYLLRAAEECMAQDGALVGMVQTSIPKFFRRTGWAFCGQSSYRRVDVRALLARLIEGRRNHRARRRLHVRPLLQWDRESLARLYLRNVWQDADRPVNGPLERTEAYWRWLLGRYGYDRVYVALKGPEQLELGEVTTRVVGYAVTRGEHIVELMASPDRPSAAAELLFRCCGDAIERGQESIVLHGPPGFHWFDIFDEAGGCRAPPIAEHGAVWMMRLLDPLAILQRLCGEFDARLAASGPPRPFDLGFLADGEKYQLEFRESTVRATADRLGRSYLKLNIADFTRLLLGRLDCNAAMGDGRLECSTQLARDAALVLFPPVPFWRPPWDEMPAIGDC